MTVNENKMVFGIYREKNDEYTSDEEGAFSGRPRGGRAGGTILDRSPLHREWFHTFNVPYRKGPLPTFYQEYGHRLVPAILLLTACFILATGRGKRKGAF